METFYDTQLPTFLDRIIDGKEPIKFVWTLNDTPEDFDLLKDASLIEELYIGKDINEFHFYYIGEQNIIKKITVDPENKFLKSENGNVLSKDGKTLYFQINDKIGVFTEGVEILEEESFACISGYKKLIIPDTVKQVAKYAFEDSEFEEIDFSKSKIECFDFDVIDTCCDLKTIKLPSTICNLENIDKLEKFENLQINIPINKEIAIRKFNLERYEKFFTFNTQLDEFLQCDSIEKIINLIDKEKNDYDYLCSEFR